MSHGGAEVERQAATLPLFAVVDPATGETVGTVPDQTVSVASAAIESAHGLFPQWARTPADGRADVLRTIARLLREETAKHARMLTRESGKPLVDTTAEIQTTARYFEWAAEEARRIYGRTIPSSSVDRRYFALKQPVGVVAAITPWNFPASLVARKAAPALAAGCTVVLRPSSRTPFTALAIADVARRAGLPEGAFTVITSRDAEPIGELFATHPLIAKLTFTGSTEVGRRLMRLAGGCIKDVNMELGGHAPYLVFADADLERAADGLVPSKFRNAGQTCSSVNRLLAHRSIATRLADLAAERTRRLTVGHGLAEGTDIGPLIDTAALTKVARHVDDAVARGARVVTGGSVARLGLSGAFYQPTVLIDVPPDAEILHEETFGPVLPIICFDTDEEAIALANGTPYGLVAYVYTRDLSRAYRMSEELQFGIVGVNDPTPFGPQIPFAVTKDSGRGVENGIEGVEAFLRTKAVSIGL